MSELPFTQLWVSKKEQKAKVGQLVRARAARAVVNDPLLIGVPSKNLDINGNAECIVGPCWGADFDDIVFELLDLKKVAGQREQLSQFAKNWEFN